MAVDRLLMLLLRIGELAFAAVVAGVNGDFLHQNRGVDSWTLGRFIYTEVVAALALFFALLWLLPFSGSFLHWPVDIVLSLCWWAAFGLLVDNLNQSTCGAVFNWNNISFYNDPCSKLKATIAFTFLSALLWLVSALLGMYWVHRHGREPRVARVDRARTRRRHWHGRSHV